MTIFVASYFELLEFLTLDARDLQGQTEHQTVSDVDEFGERGECINVANEQRQRGTWHINTGKPLAKVE